MHPYISPTLPSTARYLLHKLLIIKGLGGPEFHKLLNTNGLRKVFIRTSYVRLLWYTVGMIKIQDLIDQINNAERLGLSTGEVTSAKKELQLEFASLAFDVDQALRFDPFEDEAEVDEFEDMMTLPSECRTAPQDGTM